LSCDSDALQVGSSRSGSTRVVKVNRRKTNRRKTRPYYTGCFTTCGHFCRRWFPRSLWSKKFI